MGYYDEIADGYNELHGDEQRKKLELVKNHLKLKPTDKILDIGCGTGLSSDFEQFTVGIDPSFGLLKQNEKPSVQGVAESLPFKDRSFDAVVCLTAVHHFDADRAFSEMKRVGRTHVAVSVLKKANNSEALGKQVRSYFPAVRCIDADKDLLYIF